MLAAVPTKEAEDQALLDSGIYSGTAAPCMCASVLWWKRSVQDGAADWRDREVIKFRIMRKRALRQAMEKLQAAILANMSASSGAERLASEL